MTIMIQLTQEKTTLVDDEDNDLSLLKWCASKSDQRAYAIRRKPSGRGKVISMHRVIMSRMLGRELRQDEFVDHVDGNKLNNRRSNLRLATITQNTMNSRVRSDNSSGYKGVTPYGRGTNKWQAYIWVNRKQVYLGGYYSTPEEAARAYNDAALTYFGEFARLNDIPA